MRFPSLVFLSLLVSVLALGAANAQEEDADHEGAVAAQVAAPPPENTSAPASAASALEEDPEHEGATAAQVAGPPPENTGAPAADIAVPSPPAPVLGSPEDVLLRSVGTLTFSITACENAAFGQPRRSVEVHTEMPYYENSGVTGMILQQALEFAWRECPQHFLWVDGSAWPGFHNDVSSVDVYLPDGTHAIQAQGYVGDSAYSNGSNYHWSQVTDVGAIARQQAADQAARAEQDQQRAQMFARRQIAAENRWNTSMSWLDFFVLCGVLIWLFTKREVIARWYYFLTPHPATGVVNAAIESGVDIDGKTFAAIMRPLPGGKIEKDVRAQQARVLSAKAQRHMEALRAEAERVMAEAVRDKDFINAQDELVKAATAHERAKARLNALRKQVG